MEALKSPKVVIEVNRLLLQILKLCLIELNERFIGSPS